MRAFVFLGFLVLASCGEAPFKAPRPRGADLDGAPPKSASFQSGEWTDDYGDRWKASVDGAKVSAVASCGPRLGSHMSGVVTDGVLDYRMADSAGTVYATGQATLINSQHAFFETRFQDGSVGSEGLLHFLHTAPMRGAGAAPPIACAEIPVPPPLASPPEPKP